MPRSRLLVAAAISDGAATTTARKPRPSRNRLTKSCAPEAARAPPSPLATISARPAITVRHRLATAPNTIALSIPVTLKMDANQSAATMLRPNSARIDGSAGGKFSDMAGSDHGRQHRDDDGAPAGGDLGLAGSLCHAGPALMCRRGEVLRHAR